MWLEEIGISTCPTCRRMECGGDHLTVLALATALSYNIPIVSSAAGDDCFDIVIEPNGHAAHHDDPLLLGPYAENHFVSLKWYFCVI